MANLTQSQFSLIFIHQRFVRSSSRYHLACTFSRQSSLLGNTDHLAKFLLSRSPVRLVPPKNWTLTEETLRNRDSETMIVMVSFSPRSVTWCSQLARYAQLYRKGLRNAFSLYDGYFKHAGCTTSCNTGRAYT